MPTISRQDLDSTTLHLTVTLTRDELKPKLDAELKKFRQRAVIKGFRPGHAPVAYVKNLYGEAIFTDLFNDLVGKEVYDYLRETKLNVLGQPLPIKEQPRQYTFKIDNPEPEYDVVFEVGYAPDFEIVGLDKNQVYERFTISNLDELAAEELESARERVGKHSTVEGHIEENDMIVIDAKEVVNGQIKPDGHAASVTIHVKSVPDEAVKANILTMKKGDTLRFSTAQIDPVEDEQKRQKFVLHLTEEQAGQVSDEYEGEIVEVKRYGKADLDDSFFEEYFQGSAKNEEEALDSLKKGINEFYLERAKALVVRDIQDRLIELNQFPLPVNFLKRWLAVNNEGLSEFEIESEIDRFTDGLRWNMIKDKITDQFDIFVSDEEIREAYAARLTRYFRTTLPENILTPLIDRFMKSGKEMKDLTEELEAEKFFDVLIEQVTIADKPLPLAEFKKTFDRIIRERQGQPEVPAGGENDEVVDVEQV